MRAVTNPGKLECVRRRPVAVVTVFEDCPVPVGAGRSRPGAPRRPKG
ncbi:hypothetical protein AB0M97_23785 [Streptomyces sp. NPDC051207]